MQNISAVTLFLAKFLRALSRSKAFHVLIRRQIIKINFILDHILTLMVEVQSKRNQ